MYLAADSSADVTIPLVGSPTSVSYRVYDHTGQLLDQETVVPDAGAAELTIIVAPAFNAVAVSPGWERRTVRWSYSVGGRTYNGSRSYKIEDGVFHDADEDLVRKLLGVDTTELADDGIDLTSAFFEFRSRTDPVAMDLALASNDNRALLIARAIAALAALDHVDGMAMQVALKETSGSNSYERGAVDWEALRANLATTVSNALLALLTVDIYMPVTFDVATRTDAITG